MDKKPAGIWRYISIKNLILMAVVLVVILAAIFAWYTENYEVTASETSISAKGADNVELALPNDDGSFPISNSKWSTQLDFKLSGYLKNLVKDVTSNGQQFAMPNFEAASGLEQGRKVIADDVWVDGLSSKEALTNDKVNDDDQYNYISLDFYIRSKQQNINVTGESFLAAASEAAESAKPLKGDSVYRCSSYGAAEGNQNAFSADAVVGAMRISLLGAPVDSVSTSNGVTTETGYGGVSGENAWSTAAQLRFLWLPRPDIYLKTDNNSNNWRLYTGIKPSGNSDQGDLTGTQLDEIAKSTYTHSFYEGQTVTGGVKKGLEKKNYSDAQVYLVPETDTTANVFHVTKISSTDSQVGTTGYTPTFGQSANVASGAPETSKNIQFTAAPNDNRETSGYYVYKFTLNIWIEGEDAEARRSMNNGEFNLELDFGT